MALRRYEVMKVGDTKPAWPPDPERKISQPKWNGIRILGEYAIEQVRPGQSQGRVRLKTRGGNDYTDRFTPVKDQLPAALQGKEAVVDGEMVRLFGPHNRHSHNTLYKPGGLLMYFIFDILELNRDSLINKRWQERNDILLDLVEPQDNIGLTLSYTTPEDLFDDMYGWDLEGIVIKDINSIYKPGSRSEDWQKAKFEPDPPGHRRR